MNNPTEPDLISKFRGWRRLIFCGAVICASTSALFMGVLESSEWMELSKWLSVTYLGSDGVEKVSTAWQNRAQTEKSGGRE